MARGATVNLPRASRRPNVPAWVVRELQAKRGRFLRFAVLLGAGNEAADAVQIASAWAFVAWSESAAPDPEAFGRWLGGIVRNVVLNMRVHRRARPLASRPEEGEEEEGATEAPDGRLEARDELRRLAPVIEAATTPERLRAWTWIVEGGSAADLAALDGVPLGTVYTWIRAARRDITAAVQRLTAAEDFEAAKATAQGPRR